GLRVSPEEEIEGLDYGEHGIVAYPDFQAVTHSVGIPGSASASGYQMSPVTVSKRAPAHQ
ncbi:MAG: ammonia permease, partial [Candidatus Methylomirabilis sp.]